MRPLHAAVLAACAGCAGPPATRFYATTPQAPPPAPTDHVEVYREIPQRPARVLGIVEYGPPVRRYSDLAPIIEALRVRAARAGADALLLDGCIVRWSCAPRAVALTWQGATHVLSRAELPGPPSVGWQAGDDPFWHDPPPEAPGAPNPLPTTIP